VMGYQLIFVVAYFIIGLSLAIFAEPIARKDYNIDLRWKILLMFGIKFRIWFLRIAGIIMICMALFILVQSWALQFT
jgi:hypothetical protein